MRSPFHLRRRRSARLIDVDALLIPTFLCPKAWESMAGNEKERHCTYCHKSVHNLAAMTARERLALLSSPAAKVCSRYLAAIRRPAKGKEALYRRHLLKYGAGVAVASTALVVLWERQGEAEQARYYQVAGIAPGTPMPRAWYVEKKSVLLGDVVCPRPPVVDQPQEKSTGTDEVQEITLDAASVERAFQPRDESPATASSSLEKEKGRH